VNRGDGTNEFPPEQVQALKSLALHVADTHDIPPENIIRHQDAQPFYPQDKAYPFEPPKNFDWGGFKQDITEKLSQPQTVPLKDIGGFPVD
jgi:N-acetyl-anhydromuramyl-L-alanine amidase AmpD